MRGLGIAVDPRCAGLPLKECLDVNDLAAIRYCDTGDTSGTETPAQITFLNSICATATRCPGWWAQSVALPHCVTGGGLFTCWNGSQVLNAESCPPLPPPPPPQKAYAAGRRSDQCRLAW